MKQNNSQILFPKNSSLSTQSLGNASIENQTKETQTDAPENPIITKALCTEEERLAFLPKYLGNAFASFEKRLYYWDPSMITTNFDFIIQKFKLFYLKEVDMQVL